jgi:hypothetical protein
MIYGTFNEHEIIWKEVVGGGRWWL